MMPHYSDSSSSSCAGHLLQVPAGHVWLQGDNTLNSTDSRHYGPVPYALLKGRAFCKVLSGDCVTVYRD